MANKFSKLTAGFSPERRAKIEEKKADLRKQMKLAEMRGALSLPQATHGEPCNGDQMEKPSLKPFQR